MIDYTKIKYTREWFYNPENKAHTIQDKEHFGIIQEDNIIQIGEHFLLDLIPIFENGKDRGSTDVEIWEVENTRKLYYLKERKQKLPIIPIRKITTGKQFGYPNGYWKVKEQSSKPIAGSET